MAKLAGVPEPVLARARQIADELENDSSQTESSISMQAIKPAEMEQLSIFDTTVNTGTEDILFELRDIDLSHVTPMDAMNMIYKWQNKLQERW